MNLPTQSLISTLNQRANIPTGDDQDPTEELLSHLSEDQCRRKTAEHCS